MNKLKEVIYLEKPKWLIKDHNDKEWKYKETLDNGLIISSYNIYHTAVPDGALHEAYAWIDYYMTGKEIK